MNYSLKDFWPRVLSSLVLLVMFEVIASTLLPSIFGHDIRFFFLGVFCIYLALTLHWSILPYFFLFLCWVHSIFSLEGWAINTLISLFIIIFMNFLKDMIQLENYFSNVLFYFVGLMVWDLIRVIVLGVKMNSFDGVLNLLLFDIIGNIVLSIISPFIVSLLALIWAQKKPLEA